MERAAPQNLQLSPSQVCSVRLNQMFPSSLAKDLAMECLPEACLEQYTLRRASKLVICVMPMPTTCFVRMRFTRFSKFGISFSNPMVSRLVISRRNTPDFVQGSRNFTVLLAHMFAPPLLAAHASASVSSI